MRIMIGRCSQERKRKTDRKNDGAHAQRIFLVIYAMIVNTLYGQLPRLSDRELPVWILPLTFLFFCSFFASIVASFLPTCIFTWALCMTIFRSLLYQNHFTHYRILAQSAIRQDDCATPWKKLPLRFFYKKSGT